jgi:succinate dehydrogenase/fumarate reductase flavoprotein subunit
MPSIVPSELGPAAGATIVSALLAAARAAGVEIRTEARVRELRFDNGIAHLTSADGHRFSAAAVVLASGGFGSNAELLARYWPDATQYGDWHWYIGPDENLGDGLLMGIDAGGTVVGHNWGQWIETPNFERIVDPFTPPWLVYVNREGRRFISETAPYVVLPDAVAAQTGGTCFAVLSEGILSGPIDDPAFADPYGMGADFDSSWTKQRIRAQVAKGAVASALTLAELAVKIGIDPDGLAGTIEIYNRDAAAGRDTVFDKPAKLMLPITDPPYYTVEVRRAVLGMTFAGLRTDERARVLDRGGYPIAGLFAAGEIVGGLTGPTYPGGGVMISNAVVFGRIAGRGAARVAVNGTS